MTFSDKCLFTAHPMLGVKFFYLLSTHSVSLPNMFATCSYFNKVSFSDSYLECLEVVDENVWEPEFVDQFQVDRYKGLPSVSSRAGIQLFQEPIGNVQPRLLPKNVEVTAERHRVFLKISIKLHTTFLGKFNTFSQKHLVKK